VMQMAEPFRVAQPYHAMTAFSANASPTIMMMSVIQSMERFRRGALGESWVLIADPCRSNNSMCQQDDRDGDDHRSKVSSRA
jgi:hypothetical protein